MIAPHTFDSLATIAAQCGMRLERGYPGRPRGMQSGYILWRAGLWRQLRNLRDVARELEVL